MFFVLKLMKELKGRYKHSVLTQEHNAAPSRTPLVKSVPNKSASSFQIIKRE